MDLPYFFGRFDHKNIIKISISQGKIIFPQNGRFNLFLDKGSQESIKILKKLRKILTKYRKPKYDKWTFDKDVITRKINLLQTQVLKDI
jgi:hypothetical protein